ncbi:MULTISPECIES: DnaD domain protein [Staphylococcus]|uniref:DnaD domain protein n=1 Tax=Staphylococcus TaxID=1279 RepID=UPI000BC3619E|nr:MULTISPECIES: DnaD domain protein [Staphylococcus]ATH60697.1 DNA replication protein DnaD [Staphylococcus nepalensis]ATH65744.1 DNA replication protein DnaD [Staphylococcus nepalensis]AWI45122.1 DNA replication protein DnaD [Staphylococcus nepalensis]WQL19502.1 DnaD domain protein [Staphylococcus nepalensis]
MATFRVYKESGNFVTVHKNFIHDPNISWKAKGILLYLLSRPDDWQVYEKELEKHSLDGRDSLKNGIKELETTGYIVRTRKRDDKGRLREYEYSVYEQPTQNGLSNVGLSNVGKTNTGLSNVGKPVPTNNDFTNNELTNNNNTDNDSSSTQPSPFDFYQENGFGMLKPYVAEQINYWIDDFEENGNEIVNEAMKEAVNNNVTNWNYVNTILKAWYNDGVKNLEDVKARNNKRSNKDKVLTGQDMLERMKHDPSYWD